MKELNHKLDINIILEENALLKVRPDLFSEWDFEKNNELGLDVYKVTKGENKIAWWNCKDCGSNYDMRISGKTRYRCPYCSGYRVNDTNSLFSLNPELSKEWHSEKNFGITPSDVTCGSGKKVWWLGECGHDWEAVIGSREKGGHGCPYCANIKLLTGFNDMWTTNPELASLLANPEDGYKYMQCSNKKTDWKCPDCGETIKSKNIAQIKKLGFRCPICTDGRSYPEKVVYVLLRHLNVDFEWEKGFFWSRQKRYDFYLPEHKIIIEVHGLHHYDGRLESMGGNSLENERLNDELKEQLARSNGIGTYIVINAEESDFDYIKKSILESELINTFKIESFDWKIVHDSSLKSIVKESVSMWNSGYSVKEIAKKLNINKVTVRRYLNRCTKQGLCEYIPSRHNTRKIVQLEDSANYKLIKRWKSISCAQKELEIYHVGSCCRGEREFSGGFKWMYEEDYENIIINAI